MYTSWLSGGGGADSPSQLATDPAGCTTGRFEYVSAGEICSRDRSDLPAGHSPCLQRGLQKDSNSVFWRGLARPRRWHRLGRAQHGGLQSDRIGTACSCNATAVYGPSRARRSPACGYGRHCLVHIAASHTAIGPGMATAAACSSCSSGAWPRTCMEGRKAPPTTWPVCRWGLLLTPAGSGMLAF